MIISNLLLNLWDLHIGSHKFNDGFKNEMDRKYIYIISHFNIGESFKK